MTSRLAAICDAVVTSIAAPEAALGDRAALFAGRGLDPRDQGALAALDDQTFSVYRKLVRRTLRGAIDLELPRTASLLGDRFSREVDAFLSSELSRSHYLRDVAFELVAYVAPRWAADASIPPFALDLARHELAAFRVASAPPHLGGGAVEPALELDRACVFDEAAELTRYGYPVHELAEGQTALEPSPTALLVYRDAEGEARFLRLSPLAASIVEALLGGAALGPAIQGATAAHGVEPTPTLLQETATLLADLANRGVLLGSLAGATTMVRP